MSLTVALMSMVKNFTQVSIEETSWEKIRDQVKVVAPDIFSAIEQVSPDKSYKLYLASYPFGTKILDQNGILNIPYQNQILPLTNIQLPDIFRTMFGYNGFCMPMALILSGQVQLYSEQKNTEVGTEDIYSAGVMLATRRLLDNHSSSYHPRYIWNMTSGNRTSLMLPSISDTASFARLKKEFNLSCRKPENHEDHWPLFVKLANHKVFPKKWNTQLLLFSQKWLNHNDGTWAHFRLALYKRSWDFSAYPRNASTTNRMWEDLVLKNRKKKINSFIFHMVKHLVETAFGETIVHAPEDGQDLGGPFEDLSKIFMDIYGLKKYAPIIMSPYVFNPGDHRPAYVSHQMIDAYWVQLLDYNPESLIGDAREIKHELKDFMNKLLDNEPLVEGTPFLNLPNINFNFYHADHDPKKELLPAEKIFDNDPAVTRWQKAYPNNAAIPQKNPFLRSCVKLSVEKDETS